MRGVDIMSRLSRIVLEVSDLRNPYRERYIGSAIILLNPWDEQAVRELMHSDGGVVIEYDGRRRYLPPIAHLKAGIMVVDRPTGQAWNDRVNRRANQLAGRTEQLIEAIPTNEVLRNQVLTALVSFAEQDEAFHVDFVNALFKSNRIRQALVGTN